MESWFHNIWFRRLWPVVLIGLLWYGWSYYRKHQAVQEVQREDKIALTTAQLWVASALMRHQPDVYTAFRDSLMNVNRLSDEEIDRFLARYRGEDVQLSDFSEKVKHLVDSLVRQSDSSRSMMIDSMIYEDTVGTS
jgi:hypothetical protein